MTGNTSKTPPLSGRQQAVMLVSLFIVGVTIGVLLQRLFDVHWLITSATIGLICGLGQLPASKVIRRLSP